MLGSYSHLVPVSPNAGRAASFPRLCGAAAMLAVTIASAVKSRTGQDTALNTRNAELYFHAPNDPTRPRGVGCPLYNPDRTIRRVDVDDVVKVIQLGMNVAAEQKDAWRAEIDAAHEYETQQKIDRQHEQSRRDAQRGIRKQLADLGTGKSRMRKRTRGSAMTGVGRGAA